MSLHKSGDIAGFQFSKVKLNTKNWNSTDNYEKNIPSKVKDISGLSISTTSAPDLDFLALTIPFICLFSLSMTICLLNILKTSLLSSSLTGQTQGKFQHVRSPDINIIEPSSIVAANDDDVHGFSCGDSEFIYLAHA
jgi:hypothetical protein